jgi:hypothetical protein
MGVFTDRVRLLSGGKRKAFFSRIHAAEQQESSPAVREWLSELHHYIRKTVGSSSGFRMRVARLSSQPGVHYCLLHDTSIMPVGF